MLQRTYFPDRLAGKYFQLAAFVMLVYDHSKYFFLAVQATRLTSALSVLTFFQEVGGFLANFDHIKNIEFYRWRGYGIGGFHSLLSSSSSIVMAPLCNSL